SIGVLFSELRAAYAAALAGRIPQWQPLIIQYRDYAAWQRDDAASVAADVEKVCKTLERAPLILDLPTDKPRPPVQSHRGAQHAVEIPAHVLSEMRQLGRATGTTPFMILLSVFAMLLARRTGQHDILVGTPVANRDHYELEALIGLFVNTVVVRIQL